MKCKKILALCCMLLVSILVATEFKMDFAQDMTPEMEGKTSRDFNTKLPIIIYSPPEILFGKSAIGNALLFPAPKAKATILHRGPEFAIGQTLKRAKLDTDAKQIMLKTKVGILNHSSSDTPVIKMAINGVFSIGFCANGELVVETDKGVFNIVDEKGKGVALAADGTPVEIAVFIDTENKKCQLVVNNVQQGELIDFYQAQKFKNLDTLALRSYVDSNDPNYLQGAVYSVDYTAPATPIVTDKKAQPIQRNTSTKKNQGVSDLSKHNEIVNDVKGITPTAELVANETFIINQKVGKTSERPPFKCWTGVGAGKGVFTFSSGENDSVIANLKAIGGMTRLQFGLQSDPNKIKKAGGQLVTFEATISTKDITLGEGPQMQLFLEGPGNAAYNVNFAPKYKTNNKSRIEPTLGTNEDLVIKETFRLPEKTETARLLCYHMNSDGESTWKNIKFYYSPDAKEITFPMKKSFPSVEETKKALLERNLARFEKLKNKITEQTGPMPSGESLYTLKSAINNPHPKMLLSDITLEELSRRGQDPAFAKYANEVKRQADGFLELNQDKPNMDVEDPMRSLAQVPVWMATAYYIESDPAKKAVYLEGFKTWVKKLISWGLPVQDLPLSTEVWSFALTYDWMYNVIDEDLKAAMRKQMIDGIRMAHDHSITQFMMWRYIAFSANHNWFNYMSQAMVAMVLWNTQDPYFDQKELKQWLNDAVQNFYYVEHIHSADGFSIEGPLYQDYGLVPYFDYAVFAEKFLDAKYEMIATPGVENMAIARLSMLLPNNQGFMLYSDANKKQYSSYPFFRYLANRFNDGNSQLLADIMEKNVGAPLLIAKNMGPQYLKSMDWRNLFWYNPNVKATQLDKLPLFKNGDQLGVYNARSSWSDPKASFFGLRCGHPIGKTAYKFFGEVENNGHCYPEQGSFSFYIGDDELLPGVNYERTKLSSFHNLTLFEGKAKQAGTWVGQAGEGAAWFNIGNIRTQMAKKSPEVLKIENTADYSAYLCDIGGFFGLQKEANAKELIFPEYKRIIVYLPKENSVVVADLIKLEEPRKLRFRLLTGGKTMKVENRNFNFNIGANQYTVKDFSGQDYKRTSRFEQTHSWGNTDRQVAELESDPTTDAIFAAAIGPEAEVNKLEVKVDSKNVTIKLSNNKTIKIDWAK